MLIELPSTLAGAEKLGSVGRSRLRQPQGLPSQTRIETPLGFQFLALGKERFLEGHNSRFVETSLKDWPLLGYGIGIPEHAKYLQGWTKGVSASIDQIALICLDTLGGWLKWWITRLSVVVS
jgi:hypothetical protein